MSEITPRVTIGVQSYKNVEMLRMCLQSIAEHADQTDVEVIVADAATEQETKLLMQEEFPAYQFIPHAQNVGFVALVNACLKQSRGEYIFILNPDTILESETIAHLVAYMDEHQDVAMCGPAQKNFDGRREITRFNFYKLTTILYRRTLLGRLPFAKRHLERFQMKDRWDVTTPYPAPWVIGSAMFVRRRAYDVVGEMDTRFFMYMEDVDWCRRFWEAGLRVVYHPGITLFHFYGKGSAGKVRLGSMLFNRLTWIHMRSALTYFSKYRFQSSPFCSEDTDARS